MVGCREYEKNGFKDFIANSKTYAMHIWKLKFYQISYWILKMIWFLYCFLTKIYFQDLTIFLILPFTHKSSAALMPHLVVDGHMFD